MKITKIFLPISIVISFFISCSATLFNKEDPILRNYMDVEGVEHLWRIDMDTLVFPRDNHLLNQNCYLHGGDVFGGESIKVMMGNQDSIGNETKQYIIRRVYPHIVEWKDSYEY